MRHNTYYCIFQGIVQNATRGKRTLIQIIFKEGRVYLVLTQSSWENTQFHPLYMDEKWFLDLDLSLLFRVAKGWKDGWLGVGPCGGNMPGKHTHIIDFTCYKMSLKKCGLPTIRCSEVHLVFGMLGSWKFSGSHKYIKYTHIKPTCYYTNHQKLQAQSTCSQNKIKWYNPVIHVT